jgi:hypothetical protein
MAPGTSLLFLNTSRLAPDSRYQNVSMFDDEFPLTHLLQQQPCQFLPTIAYALTVCCIDHPYERICLLEIVLPVRAQCLLSADIP